MTERKPRFIWYELSTSDQDAAEAFYRWLDKTFGALSIERHCSIPLRGTMLSRANWGSTDSRWSRSSCFNPSLFMSAGSSI